MNDPVDLSHLQQRVERWSGRRGADLREPTVRFSFVDKGLARVNERLIARTDQIGARLERIEGAV